MKKTKLFLIFISILIVCSGCTGKYTLTYEDDQFTEELVIADINENDEKALVKYVEGSKYLVIDDNNAYHYKEKDKNKIYTYNMGKEFLTSPLINTCFENVFVLDEEDYIHIKTEGDFYCQSYEVEVYFKTDKRVEYSNADSINDNVYKWNSLEKGIELQFSKTDMFDKDSSITKNANDVYMRLIICIVFIVIIVFTVSHLKKKNNE